MPTRHRRILLIGDSVTDAARREPHAPPLGLGYPALVAEAVRLAHPQTEVLNAGISGDRARDLAARWQDDCLAVGADLVSILVGVNDTWRRYDSADPTSVESFESTLLGLVQDAQRSGSQVVLMEPFLVPVRKEQHRWLHEDLAPRAAAVRRVAERTGTTFVPLQAALDAVAAHLGAETVAADGVHPTALGHAIVARRWLTVTGLGDPGAIEPLGVARRVRDTTQRPAWTLSGFGDEIDDDPRVQCAVLNALGASHIEVRSAWGTNVVDMDEARLDELGRVIEEHAMRVSAIASPIGKVPVGFPVTHEVGRLAAAIRAAHRLGTRYVRVFSFYPGAGVDPDSVRDAVVAHFEALVELAAREDIVLLHENEKEIFGDIPRRINDIVSTLSSPHLRVAWDPANFVQVGVRPYSEAYPLLAPYLEYLQVKDALRADGSVVPAGLGDGEIVQTVRALRDSGYTGFASLEPHLAAAFSQGGFSGPDAFGQAARAFAGLTDAEGVHLR